MGTTYILVHQAGLADATVAEDDDLHFASVWFSYRRGGWAAHLEQDLSSRRHGCDVEAAVRAVGQL